MRGVVVSIQPKPEKGLRGLTSFNPFSVLPVSIQPKPEKGLRAQEHLSPEFQKRKGFNPAEAREGFKRYLLLSKRLFSICFNPAEAREGFKSG